ncbi:MAG: hypothetical protein K0R12_1195 [Gammaproteobacteria bacterium]|jgi:NTE family protein|nr:hypothetical protein [Gammaproteobacteria bacterium]
MSVKIKFRYVNQQEHARTNTISLFASGIHNLNSKQQGGITMFFSSSSPFYHNLVFAGGSVKGIAYVGAFKVLAAQCDLSQLKRVAGTSAGSIFALLVALGFNVEEMRTILSEFQFKAMLDSTTPNYKPMSNAQKLLTTVEKQSSGSAFAKVPAMTGAAPMLKQLQAHHGLFEGEYFREWAEALIRKQIQRLTEGSHTGKYLTFAELAKLSTQYPGLRQLSVVGVNLNLAQAVTFSADNPNTADVIISDALRISMSIPGLFQPHRIYRKKEGFRQADESTNTWIDGGWMRNYPIDIFDEIEAPQYTLGFNLVDEKVEGYLRGESTLPQQEITGLGGYANALFNTPMNQQRTQLLLSECDKARTISIPSLGISMLAFNISEEQQANLITSGYRAAAAFFGLDLSSENPAVNHTVNPTADSTSLTVNLNRKPSTMFYSNASSSSSSSSAATNSPSLSRLNPEHYVMINVWTAADDAYIPGHNVGHVSIQTPLMYISLWPAPRAASERVSRDCLSTLEALKRNMTKHFAARPPNYVQTYRMDCILEGLSEGEIAPYQFRQPGPKGYCLVIHNSDTHQFREVQEQASQFTLSEHEQLLWVKPLEASVRLAFYSLDAGRVHAEFRALRNSIQGWSMAGSNLLQQALGSETNESCASLAYRLLSASGFQSLLSIVQQGSLRSQTSSVVKPGILAQRAVEAKLKEQTQSETAITADWQVPGESNVGVLKACYCPAPKKALPVFKEEDSPASCICM